MQPLYIWRFYTGDYDNIITFFDVIAPTEEDSRTELKNALSAFYLRQDAIVRNELSMVRLSLEKLKKDPGSCEIPYIHYLSPEEVNHIAENAEVSQLPFSNVSFTSAMFS